MLIKNNFVPAIKPVTMTDETQSEDGLVSLSDRACIIPKPISAGARQDNAFELTDPTKIKYLRLWNDRDHSEMAIPATKDNVENLAVTGCWIEAITENKRSFWWDTSARKSQWNIPGALLHSGKNETMQEFVCEDGISKWFDIVADEIILVKPEMMKSHKEKKAEQRKSDAIKQGQNSPRAKNPPRTVQHIPKAWCGQFVRNMSRSPLSLSEFELQILLDSGLDPFLCHSLKSIYLQYNIVLYMTRKATGIQIPKGIRLRLKAWYERSYLAAGKCEAQKAYTEFLWKHRHEAAKYFPSSLGFDATREFKEIVELIIVQVDKMKRRDDHQGIADIVNFLFLGKRDTDESVSIENWNFEALDFPEKVPGPKHPAPWIPDEEHTRLMDLFYERDKPSARAIRAIAVQLRTLFEEMEDDLQKEEPVDGDDDVLELENRWTSRLERKQHELDRKRERDERIERDALEGLNVLIAQEAGIQDRSSVLINALDRPLGIDIEPEEDVAVSQTAQSTYESSPDSFDLPSDMESREEMPDVQTVWSTREDISDMFLNDFDLPSSVYSREEQDRW
ncbi:hypothetical protein EG328_011315 [Venturia inaequalis]|uniref:WW domain-containing protein n=2 Tax=Venturia inaequalis TaxID=5025 RepID=A0A8H3V6D1_VENIN|nr:hypothetical protein EG328_011315 [Venturia inaequalis]